MTAQEPECYDSTVALRALHQTSTEASEADWEGRLNSAVESAEQWKSFADKLAAERAQLDAELATARAEAQAKFQMLLISESTALNLP